MEGRRRWESKEKRGEMVVLRPRLVTAGFGRWDTARQA